LNLFRISDLVLRIWLRPKAAPGSWRSPWLKFTCQFCRNQLYHYKMRHFFTLKKPFKTVQNRCISAQNCSFPLQKHSKMRRFFLSYLAQFNILSQMRHFEPPYIPLFGYGLYFPSAPIIPTFNHLRRGRTPRVSCLEFWSQPQTVLIAPSGRRGISPLRTPLLI